MMVKAPGIMPGGRVNDLNGGTLVLARDVPFWLTRVAADLSVVFNL
jgi:hypothetical protein